MSEATISTPKHLHRERHASARRAALSAPRPQLESEPAVTAYDEHWFQGRPQLP